jgi:flagellar motor protein MotB
MKRFAAPNRKGKKYETWQIIYIDLMTNMMMFFLVVWIISQHQEQGVSNKLGDETVKMVTLPGDVLFAPGSSQLTSEGQAVFRKLLDDPSGAVLSFETGGLQKRLLVIHGHTDSDGEKDKNFELGFSRALAAYREMRKYGSEVPDHVVICSHADNTPAEEVPVFAGSLSSAEEAAIREAKSKNRRITIEDKLVGRLESPKP